MPEIRSGVCSKQNPAQKRIDAAMVAAINGDMRYILLAASFTILSPIIADAQKDLWNAAHGCNLPEVQRAIRRGAKVNSQSVSSNRITALMGAAGGACVEVVEYLLQKGAKVNLKDKNGVTALMRAMGTLEIEDSDGKQSFAEVVQLLIAAGAKVNDKDKAGNTVMMYAKGEVYPYKGYSEFVRLVEEAGGE